MAPDNVPLLQSSELSHKTVLIYIFVFLLIVCAIGAALYFFVFKKKSCKIDSDCSTGEICHDGKCQKLVPSNKCKSDNDCGNNQVCDINSGKCVTKPSQKQCQQNEDCGNAQCINNTCVFANFIVAFDTADLPDGWVECDGNNGTPDIRGRFIKGCDEKDTDFGKPGGATDYSNHMLTLAETYHEHVIPAQALDTFGDWSYKEVSCFYDYNSMKNTSGNYDGTNSYPQYTVSTVYTDTPPASEQTAIDLRPKCTSVIFAMPLYNATNFFPVGSIIWLYVENSQPPSLSNSDWKYYSEGTDGFFIGRKDNTNPPGDTFGNNTITLTSSNIPSHVHLFYYPLSPDFQNKCLSGNNRSCPDGNIFRTDDPYPSNIQKTSHETNNNTSSPSLEILPPYQSLFCIKKTNSNINDIPIGSICAWNSTIIPEGWAICNGKKNTPDLTSRFILNEEKDNTLKQGGKNSIILKDIIPQHYHTYNFVQYKPGVNNCHYQEKNYNISDCNSGQAANGGDIFPIVAMCDNSNYNNNNCIFDSNNSNNVSYSSTNQPQPVNLPPPPAPYPTNPTNPPTSISLDPPHIKLIYIMKTS